MKEIALPSTTADIERESFGPAMATILELPLADVPSLETEPDPATGWLVSRWLGGFGLGLVPIADAQTFAWPGPWLARIRPDDESPRFVVTYGVPSGIVWDPAGGATVPPDRIRDGFVLAAADIALARPPRAEPPRRIGVLEQIWISPGAGEQAQARSHARAQAGRGLEGDRHTLGRGIFPSNLPGSSLTLIEAEVCESFQPPLHANEHRRNLVTRGMNLNRLVGSEFTVGTVRCRGARLCEPCAVLEGYASRPVYVRSFTAAASAPTSWKTAISKPATR